MKQTILFTFFILFYTFGVFAQDFKKIAVQGSSEIKVMPDEVMLTVSLSEKAMKTADVTAALNKKAKQVTTALEKSGVTGYEMTADNYYVNVNRVYLKGTAKDSGYVASQNLSILVKDTDEDLLKVIQALHGATDLGFQMEYRLSDEVRKTYREKLLQLAIADAKKKADIIAASLNLAKVSVHQINYHSGSSFEPVVYRAESMRMKASDQYTPPTLSPDEQTLTDQISMVFTFETGE